MKSTIIYISDADDNIVKDLHMIPAHSVEEALQKRDQILGNNCGKITVIFLTCAQLKAQGAAGKDLAAPCVS